MRLTQFIEELRADVTSAFRQMRAFLASQPSPRYTGAGNWRQQRDLCPCRCDVPAAAAIYLTARSTRHGVGALPERVPLASDPLDFADWADQNQSFDAMAAFLTNSVALIGPDGAAEQVTSQMVSARFFDVLGVTPIAGRTFVLSDTVEPNSVVLSEGFWRRRFGADSTLVGRSITVAGRHKP